MRFNTSLMKSPVRYGLCLSAKDYADTLKRIKPSDLGHKKFIDKDDAASTRFIRVKGGTGVRVIVCYRPSKKPIEEIHADLVHEAVHVWQYIRDHIGEERAGDEQEAYSIERIALRLMVAYKKRVGA